MGKVDDLIVELGDEEGDSIPQLEDPADVEGSVQDDSFSLGSFSLSGGKRNTSVASRRLSAPASAAATAPDRWGDTATHAGKYKRAEGHRQALSADSLRTGVEWSSLGLSRPLLRALVELKFDEPTPVQRDAIPFVLQGRDVFGHAETGSGKTAAYFLPICERLLQTPAVRLRKRTPHGISGGRAATKALVLQPTRELAQQAHEMLGDIVKHTLLSTALVAGGFDIRAQESMMRQQPDIVVATPGRLLDILSNSQSVHLEVLEVVVLDECDRLLEFGFKQECLEVLNKAARGRQTLLFSATTSGDIIEFSTETLNKPVKVPVGNANNPQQSEGKTGPEKLQQEFVPLKSDDQREAVLLHLCTSTYSSRVIVFFQTKKLAHRIALIFRTLGLSYAELHGNLTQTQRAESLERFQSGDVDVLLASELASRGLDIEDVTAVINFSPPLDLTRYVHRVGRTARMGRSGASVTLYTPGERALVKKFCSSYGPKSPGGNAVKFLSRRVPSDAVEKWEGKLKNIDNEITEMLEQERVERQVDRADMEVRKAENVATYHEEILSKPKKQWYLTTREKRETKVHAREVAEQRGEEALQGPPKKVKETKEEKKARLKEQRGTERKSEAKKQMELQFRLQRVAIKRAKKGLKEKRLRVNDLDFEEERPVKIGSRLVTPKSKKRKRPQSEKAAAPKDVHEGSAPKRQKVQRTGKFKSQKKFKRR